MSWNQQHGGGGYSGGGGGGGGGRYGGGAAGGGYRGPKRAPYNADGDRRPRDAPPPPESTGEKLRKQVLAVGDGLDFDAATHLPPLISSLEKQFFAGKDAILEGFTYGILEQPYKIPYYAAIVSLLSGSPNMPGSEERWSAQDAQKGEEVKAIANDLTIGRQIIDQLVKAFQTAVDECNWLNTRLLVQTFAHLATTGVVSAASVLALLQSLMAVVDELGVNPSRVEQVITCVGESLIRGGAVLHEHDAVGVASILAAIEVYVMTRPSRRDLVAPFGAKGVHADEDLPEDKDTLVHLHRALAELSANAFQAPTFLPRPHLLFPEAEKDPLGVYELPLIMIPPAIVDENAAQGVAKEGRTEGWATVELEIFEEEIVPSPSIPSGWILRQIVHDTITIFEVNRKECARLLLELPNWLESGTFKPPANVQVDSDGPQPTWSLESLVVSNIIATIIRLPSPPHLTLYYTSLLIELCKFSPSTVAPPVGKTARKFYAALDEGMDVECARRFADWLSVHLSNFGFQWLWKDWVPDLELPHLHPKISFMRRVVELEVRLSYHDRIKGTLPEPMRDPAAGIIGEEAEAPVFDYGNPANEHHETAKSLETAIRSKALPEQIITDLSMFPLQARSEPLSPLTRSIAIQTLLNTGSRSFSHFLNATERYLPVLRQLAETETARIDILRNVSQFWRTSGQWRLIITDKLMQYGIVGGVDVVKFLFELDDGVLGKKKVSEEWMSGQRWDVLRNAVDKIGGRVVADRRRIVGLEEAEEKRTVMSGAVPEGMDVDKETTAPEPAEGKRANPHMAVALSALGSHQQTHKQTLVLALESFVGSLLPSNADEGLAGLIKKGGWKGRESWDEGDWIAWSHWGWYREFCRLYAHHLSTYRETVESVVFAGLSVGAEGTDEERARSLVRGVWDGVLEVVG